MPLVTRNFVQLSDLVLHENDPSVGFSRESVFVDVTADTPVTIGTVAFRAKAATDTAYTLLTAAGELVATNEFVVLFGDEYSCRTDGWTLLAAETTDNAVGYVRDVILKDWLVEDIYVNADTPVLNATQFEALRHLLKAQGVILEITV